MDVHQRPESTELELRAGFEDQSLPSLLSEERFGIKPLNTRGSPSISFVCIYSCCFFLWALSASSLRSSSPSEEPRSPVSVFRRANFVASPTSSLHHHQNGPYPGRPECRSTHCSHFSSSRTSSSCSSWIWENQNPHIASRLPPFERLPTTEHIMFDIHDQELSRNAR